MAKVDWSKLEIIEEWTPVDPSNPQAQASELARIKVLSSLILKAYLRDKMNQAKRKKRQAQQSKEEVAET